MALELNEGGGKGREYPLCFAADSFETDLVRDERRGGMSFGGTGGGEDIFDEYDRLTLGPIPERKRGM
jgi:hypothetical protein